MKTLAAILSLWGLTACISYPVPPYAVSVENIDSARALKKKKIFINVLPVTAARKADDTQVNCRAAGPVKITDGRNFAQYASDALRDELALAEVTKPSAANTLRIHFNDIDFSTNGGSKWVFDAVVTYNGKSTPIGLSEKFEGSFMAQNACSEIANNYPIAVRKFNTRVLSQLLQQSGETIH